MSKIYLASEGKIVEHNVLLEDKDTMYIDRLDDANHIVALGKEFVGNGVYNTFDEAKEAAIKTFEEAIDKRTKELEELKKQKEPSKGSLR